MLDREAYPYSAPDTKAALSAPKESMNSINDSQHQQQETSNDVHKRKNPRNFEVPRRGNLHLAAQYNSLLHA